MCSLAVNFLTAKLTVFVVLGSTEYYEVLMSYYFVLHGLLRLPYTTYSQRSEWLPQKEGAVCLNHDDILSDVFECGAVEKKRRL